MNNKSNWTNYKSQTVLKKMHIIIIIRHIGNISNIVISSFIFLIFTIYTNTTIADDFNPTLRHELEKVCLKRNQDTSFQVGNNLANVFDGIPNNNNCDPGPVGGVFSSPSSPDSADIRGLQQRLQSPRESREENLGSQSHTAYAMNSGELFVQGDALQLPPAGGASPDIVFGLSSGASVFLSAGAYALDHHQNVFEDGYEAQIPTVTIGADYRINDWLLAGLALNYTNYDGNFVDGSEFDKHIFGPLLYATFIPFQGAFADVVLGYARQENSTNRLVSAHSTTRLESAVDPSFIPEGRSTSADYSVNQYTAGILAGYDQPISPLLIGPRLGLAVSHESFESFQEDGDTGLELQYNNLDRTSVQSSLGVQASVVIETAYGVVVPQAAVAWVHEYANNDRNIEARLVEAPASPSFTFQREPPARDWANIGIAVSAVLTNGLQPFIQFTTMQGNENFVSYGGTVGVRLDL